jgi:hypothetical protein
MRGIAERLAEQALGRRGVAQRRQQEIDGRTGGIDGPIEVTPTGTRIYVSSTRQGSVLKVQQNREKRKVMECG